MEHISIFKLPESFSRSHTVRGNEKKTLERGAKAQFVGMLVCLEGGWGVEDKKQLGRFTYNVPRINSYVSSSQESK